MTAAAAEHQRQRKAELSREYRARKRAGAFTIAIEVNVVDVDELLASVGLLTAGTRVPPRCARRSKGASQRVRQRVYLGADRHRLYREGFFQEGTPIAAEQLVISGPILSPRKIGSIATFTNEIFQHSTPTIEALVSQVLRESVAASLDSALLDAASGDATRPAGSAQRYNGHDRVSRDARHRSNARGLVHADRHRLCRRRFIADHHRCRAAASSRDRSSSI
jgi:hypothetical protein